MSDKDVTEKEVVTENVKEDVKEKEPVVEMTQEEEKDWVEPDDKEVKVETNPINYEELSERSKINVQDVCLALDSAGKGQTKLPKVKYKKDYIQSIKKLTNKFSDRQLNRMRVQQLKELLSQHWEQNVEEIGSVCSEPAYLPPNNDKIVKTLYSCMLLLANGLEVCTKRFSPYLGGYCLHRYPEALDAPANREQLMGILAELEEEHREVIASYCSKESRLVLIFSLSAINSVKHVDQINERPHY